MRPFLERGHFAVAHFVQNSSGIFITEIVDSAALPHSKSSESSCRKIRSKRQRLQAREDAVPAKHRHKPGETRSWKAHATQDWRRETKRRKVNQAAPVDGLHRIPVANQPWRVVEPFLQAALHIRAGSALGPAVLWLFLCIAGAHGRNNIEIGRPFRVGLNADAKGHSSLVEMRRRACRDSGFPGKRVSLVPEQQSTVLNLGVVSSLFGQGVLHLEQVRKVRPDLHTNRKFNRLYVVVKDRSALHESHCQQLAAGLPRASNRCIHFPCPAPGRTVPRNTEDRRLTVD